MHNLTQLFPQSHASSTICVNTNNESKFMVSCILHKYILQAHTNINTTQYSYAQLLPRKCTCYHAYMRGNARTQSYLVVQMHAVSSLPTSGKMQARKCMLRRKCMRYRAYLLVRKCMYANARGDTRADICMPISFRQNSRSHITLSLSFIVPLTVSLSV